ncbi:HemK2/MTQ2 family protein methyltransferase [Methanocaldococcus indicus]|uniref:HemK2/MTQ2 family protein methyltransferase n=1 Tax=Methanocaldococcus indicus TaxID=213231 RepID=UPI003C6D0348
MLLDRDVYEPAEDTYLLIRALKKLDVKDKDVLEMGTGTGIVAIELAKRGANVLAADINPKAVELAKKNANIENVNIEVIKSDLFENINKKFDIIVFNPPYLPTVEEDKIDSYLNYAFDGGKDGREILDRFIDEVKNYLKENGRVVIVQSSLTNLNKTLERFERLGFKTKILEKEKIPFEELYVILAEI